MLPRLVGLRNLPGASTQCGEEIHTPAVYLFSRAQRGRYLAPTWPTSSMAFSFSPVGIQEQRGTEEEPSQNSIERS